MQAGAQCDHTTKRCWRYEHLEIAVSVVGSLLESSVAILNPVIFGAFWFGLDSPPCRSFPVFTNPPIVPPRSYLFMASPSANKLPFQMQNSNNNEGH